MVDGGLILIKFWLEVGNKEQERRFRARIDDPLRRWKLSNMDFAVARRRANTRWRATQCSKATDTSCISAVGHRPVRR